MVLRKILLSLPGGVGVDLASKWGLGWQHEGWALNSCAGSWWVGFDLKCPNGKK